jgi:hypothetical protein
MLRLTCQDIRTQGRIARVRVCALQAVAGLGPRGSRRAMNY